MPRIEGKKEENNFSWDEFEKSVTSQNRLWTSIDYLSRIDLLTEKEISKLKKQKIQYLLVGIVEQKYIKKGHQVVQTRTIVDLWDEKFHINKEKKISLKRINSEYDELLFHIYTEGIISPHPSETLRFVSDSNFLKYKEVRKLESNLLFLLLTNKVMEDVLGKIGHWMRLKIKSNLIKIYDEEPEKLIFLKNEYIDFYLKYEDNLLKKIKLAKKILEKNPEDALALKVHFNYYTQSDNQELEKFIAFLEKNYESLKKSMSPYEFAIKSFNFFLKNKKFEKAQKIIETEKGILYPWWGLSGQEEYLNGYMQGVLFYEQKKYNDSLNVFKEVIQEINDSEVILGCYFYLLFNYLELQDEIGITKTTDYLYSHIGEIAMSDYFIFQLEIPTENQFFIRIKRAIDNGVINTSKLITIYLFKKFIHETDEFDTKSFSRKESNELLFLVEELENSATNSMFDMYVLSKGFNLLKNYDKSMGYKIKYVLNKGDEYIDTEIVQCSQSYQENYSRLLEKEIRNTSDEDQAQTDYVSELFNSDVSVLFKQKKYDIISEIYFAFEGSIQPHLFPPPFHKDEFFESKAFEVAYSLNESGYTVEAKDIYEGIEEQNSSILNNLALIYEREGNKKQAEELINKAFELSNKKDDVINQNKNRILSKETRKNQSEAVKKEKLTWGDIEIKFINENDIHILTKGRLRMGDYTTLGFKKSDDVPWLILKSISYTNIGRELDGKVFIKPENFFNLDSFKRSKNKNNLFQTYKSKLSQTLKEYFEIDNEPIPYDKTVGGYKPKLKITPLKEFRGKELNKTTTNYLTEI